MKCQFKAPDDPWWKEFLGWSNDYLFNLVRFNKRKTLIITRGLTGCTNGDCLEQLYEQGISSDPWDFINFVQNAHIKACLKDAVLYKQNYGNIWSIADNLHVEYTRYCKELAIAPPLCYPHHVLADRVLHEYFDLWIKGNKNAFLWKEYTKQKEVQIDLNFEKYALYLGSIRILLEAHLPHSRNTTEQENLLDLINLLEKCMERCGELI